ncbi:hypothetical protein OCGS_2214 [Oceaniovalibus guishaninsula JLT2003]|uniref:Uncharacterized protein n=1 Tax=Oceaniovalibus guishaninsula JLT2003 TaxID=1231392 RepID=K2HA28_9RHOB|nr:hypothetical protein [Oceaniovalibus guishaninsula]EKE43482.1 hypothetical protein OCGS_2214 [Oceaniovalibus guishaninsula JLT2003]
MKWKTVQQNWEAFVVPMQQRWPQTTEVDLLDIDGDRDRLVAYIGDRHELTRAEADEEVAEWLEGAVPADVQMDDHMDNANIRKSGESIPVGEDVYSDDREFGDDNVPESPMGRTD